MSTQSISPAAASAQYSYPAAAGAAAAVPSYFPVPFHLQNVQQPAWTAAPAVAAPAYNAVYPMPQIPQVHQLFQKDSQIITPEALATVKAAIANSEKDKKIEANKKAVPRKAAGQSWEDPTLADWPENDFRLFCGDLGNEVNDDVLTKAFSKYPSFNMARVIRDKWTGKTKGYGFVSFANASDLAAALKEMNGKYVGNRPIKLRKSTWKNRIDYEALQKSKAQLQKKFKSQKRSVLHK
uniref:RRM domain-containing protein n=1 Tax=Leersia perrieri TaxID=77586 RepID=A0A0D9VII1_9ORYZ